MRKIWVDTDLDSDDIMSLIILASRKDVEIVGISICATGAINSNKIGLLRTIEIRKKLNIDFKIVLGANQNYGNVNPKYPYVIRGQSEIGYLKNPDNTGKPRNNVYEFDKLKSIWNNYEDNSLELLCLGTTTNIAFTLEKRPQLINKFNNIVFSGSNLIESEAKKIGINGSLGNIKGAWGSKKYASPYDNDVAEWNVFSDAKAFAKLLEKLDQKTISLISLNATNKTLFTDYFLNTIKQNQNRNIYFALFGQVLTTIKDILPSVKLWDQSATSALLTPSLFKYKKAKISVLTESSIDNDNSGKIIVDSLGKEILYAYDCDYKEILKEILESLNSK